MCGQHTIDAETKQGDFLQPALNFRASPDGPDLLQFEGRLLADQLPPIPRVAMMNLCRFLRDLLTAEGDLKVR